MRMDQHSPNQDTTYRAKFHKTSRKTPSKKSGTQQNVNCCSCLVSDSTILLTWNVLHMTGHCNKTTDQAYSPFKTLLGKIRYRYQSYCATYKTHTMTTYHGGVGHAGKDRDLDPHVEDTRNIDDNESTNNSETTNALRESEIDDHLIDLLPNSQADLNILAKDIHSLKQCTEAREGQPVEWLDGIDHLEWELQTLSLTLSMQSTSTPNTHSTIWRSGIPIHIHNVHYSKTYTPYQLPTTGHCHLQWIWFNKIRRMVIEYRNSSRFH